MKDVRSYIESTPGLSDATKTDYLAQIDRGLKVFNANDLEDIPANIDAFRTRFKKSDFPHESFRTVKAYLAWRKKMVAILKRAAGISAVEQERRQREDQWADLLAEWSAINPGKNRGQISISLLADEARKVGLLPKDLTFEWMVDLMDRLSPGRRASIPKAVGLLEEARQVSPEIDAMFLPGRLPDPKTVRRAEPTELPRHIDEQLTRLIAEHCHGDYDEILEEATTGRAPATVAVYRAAAKKYLASAWASGALPVSCEELADAFEKPVFLKVMRHWIGETDEARRISDRTKRSYVGNVMCLAVRLGMPVDFMKTALTANRDLKNGRAESDTMPLETRVFCARLVQNRKAELVFKSLHLRFQERALALMSGQQPGPFSEFRIVQFGMLAAFSAIALWGVPLRIDNMRCLRHRGEDPTLILPKGGRKRAHILIPHMNVKNRKPIKAHISDGPTRALEILEWYLDEIRPCLPWAERSNYLFPGYNQEVISVTALRNWLQDHSRDLGMPMNPQNFRHGIASLYLRDHPGEYGQAARLLCNTPNVVRKHYAWIDEEAEMRKVQEEVARLGGFNDGQPSGGTGYDKQ